MYSPPQSSPSGPNQTSLLAPSRRWKRNSGAVTVWLETSIAISSSITPQPMNTISRSPQPPSTKVHAPPIIKKTGGSSLRPSRSQLNAEDASCSIAFSRDAAAAHSVGVYCQWTHGFRIRPCIPRSRSTACQWSGMSNADDTTTNSNANATGSVIHAAGTYSAEPAARKEIMPARQNQGRSLP